MDGSNSAPAAIDLRSDTVTRPSAGMRAAMAAAEVGYTHEQGGAAVLGSIQPQPLENEPHGGIALERIAAAIKADDVHFARTRIVTHLDVSRADAHAVLQGLCRLRLEGPNP